MKFINPQPDAICALLNIVSRGAEAVKLKFTKMQGAGNDFGWIEACAYPRAAAI